MLRRDCNRSHGTELLVVLLNSRGYWLSGYSGVEADRRSRVWVVVEKKEETV